MADELERCGANLRGMYPLIAAPAEVPDVCNLPKGHRGNHGLIFGRVMFEGRVVEGIAVREPDHLLMIEEDPDARVLKASRRQMSLSFSRTRW